MSQLINAPPGDAATADLITLIDVGGAGGIDKKWQPFFKQLRPVSFEPNPEQGALLRQNLTSQFDDAIVIEAALAHVTGDQNLNIAAYWGCTSIRQPNEKVLANYRIAATKAEKISFLLFAKPAN